MSFCYFYQHIYTYERQKCPGASSLSAIKPGLDRNLNQIKIGAGPCAHIRCHHHYHNKTIIFVIIIVISTVSNALLHIICLRHCAPMTANFVEISNALEPT